MARIGRPIPVSAAREIAKKYGYEQVVIYARLTGDEGLEHMTTYGVSKVHCAVAAKIGYTLKAFMGWKT